MKLQMEVELDKTEREARELMNTVDWTPGAVMVANVFRCMAAWALDAERVAALAAAMYNEPNTSLHLKAIQLALASMVKQKALRSRIAQNGRRVYEVNFKK